MTKKVRALVFVLLIALGQSERATTDNEGALKTFSHVVSKSENVDELVDQHRPQLQTALAFLAIHGPQIWQMIDQKGGVSALKDPEVRAEIRKYLMSRVTEWFVSAQAGKLAQKLLEKIG